MNFIYYLLDDEGIIDQVEEVNFEFALAYFRDNHEGEGIFVVKCESLEWYVLL